MSHKVTIRSKRWNLRRGNIKDRGYCESPDSKNKSIVISRNLTGEELLEVLIHECLHAATWDSSEQMVSETAKDIARILHRLGCDIGDF